jgi:hypothetical protein
MSSAMRCLPLLIVMGSLVAWPAEPAEDTFQRAIKVYTSGDQAAAYRMFVQAANAGNSKAAVQTG